MAVESEAYRDYHATRVRQFKELFDKGSDKIRWNLVRTHTDLGFTVMIDNDQTSVVFLEHEDDDDWHGQFSEYVSGPGVGNLLDALGIPNDHW